MPSWDEKFAEFLERVMATAASNGDPEPLKKEYDQLLNEAPEDKKLALGLKPTKVLEKRNVRPKN